mgnify:CR=1 FL=1
MVEVTQADKEAAEAIWKLTINFGSRTEMEQLCATHRIAGEQAGYERGLRDAALAVDHELAMVEMLNAEVAEPLWIEGLEHAHTRAVAAIRGLGE